MPTLCEWVTSPWGQYYHPGLQGGTLKRRQIKTEEFLFNLPIDNLILQSRHVCTQMIHNLTENFTNADIKRYKFAM